MQLATIETVRGGAAAARLASGEFADLGRIARPGTIESWLPRDVRGILEGGPDALKVVAAMADRVEHLDDAARQKLRARGVLLDTATPLLSPIPEPRLIVAAGLSYHAHLAEMSGTPKPPHPTGFMKSPHSVSGHGATLARPAQAPDHVDYEGELAVVFGSRCHNVSVGDALHHVAGYTIANDLSARDWVKEVWAATSPWEARLTWEVNVMGKQLPGFTALGPVLTTADEISDASALTLTTRVNGDVVQHTALSDLIYSIAEMIGHFSRWYAFEPGDVLLTGTPAGVGLSKTPPLFMQPGDVVEVEVDRIGTLATSFV